MQNLCEGIFILDRRGLLTYLNPAAERMFDWKREELLGKKMHDVMHHTHLDGTPFLAKDCPGLQVLETGIPLLEYQDDFIRSDGRFFPVYFSVSPIKENNQIVGAVVVFSDDTQRRQAEQAVRESEERFRLVANTAPVMICMAGVDKLCTYFNQMWLDFTGRPVERELGNGWTEGVHSEDFKRCLDIYTTAFDRREPFQMEYRLRRHDGEYCWILDSGVPRFDDDGSFTGYIGSAMDVTDRKLAEEALSRIGGRLIQAHEEERSRIARELHDDIGQRLGLLATEIERLGQSMLQLPAEIRSQTHELWQSTTEIASDVQGISHRLHSSKLKYLGIVVAARSFCRELSLKQGVDIDFMDENIPLVVPEEVGLCLYRVLQEALQNAVKYSGVRHFEVNIEGLSDEIHLTVRDAGIGFDADTAMYKQGLGLISMMERVNLVNGTISITSALNLGTEVSVRVPLSTGEQAGQAMSATP
jgi:PAS domain S-box-containing protein